jgi:hypothetical protein
VHTTPTTKILQTQTSQLSTPQPRTTSQYTTPPTTETTKTTKTTTTTRSSVPVCLAGWLPRWLAGWLAGWLND